MTDPRTIKEVSESLPDSFSFYGMGEVSRSKPLLTKTSESSDLFSGKAGVSFKLLGEPAAILVVLFDSDLDVSMYTELGNVLASKLCQRLSENGEGDLMITPPITLKPEQLKRLESASGVLRETYEHVNGNVSVLIEMLILPISMEGQVGHA